MSQRKYKIVNYVEGHLIQDGRLIPVTKSKEIMETGTKRFHNCLYVILGLNKLQRVLVDWLSEEMDERNMVRNDKYTRGMFMDFLKEIQVDGKILSYEDQSVANAFHGLYRCGLLIRHTQSVYQVNPEYYWRGSDKARIESIMMNIQFNSGATNFKILDSSKYEVKPREKKDWKSNSEK